MKTRATTLLAPRGVLIAMLLLCLLTLTAYPNATRAATIGYEPRTLEQQIAYLFGMIAQLQAQVNALASAERGAQVGGSRTDYDLDVITRTATDIADDEAELRGEVDLNAAPSATVWFEFGEDGDLDDDTRRVRVTDARTNTHRFDAVIDDLDDDTRYYFRAVAQAPGGERFYGTTRSFRTDDDRRREDDDDDGDFSLRVFERRIEAEDTIEVSYEIPDDEVRGNNWVGLYDVSADNRDYEDYAYAREDAGELTFTIDESGTYEFRLFLDNGYDDVVTSREFEVEAN